jgi:hypothetical protein
MRLAVVALTWAVTIIVVTMQYCCNYNHVWQKKAGDLGIYHYRSRIRPGNGWKKLLLRAFCNAHCNQSGGFGGYVCVPHLNGTIALLNTARME